MKTHARDVREPGRGAMPARGALGAEAREAEGAVMPPRAPRDVKPPPRCPRPPVE